MSLTPLELIDRLAALIPPPRLHRHSYHGVLAPYHAGNGSFRAATWDWSLTGSGRVQPFAPSEERTTALIRTLVGWHPTGILHQAVGAPRCRSLRAIV